MRRGRGDGGESQQICRRGDGGEEALVTINSKKRLEQRVAGIEERQSRPSVRCFIGLATSAALNRSWGLTPSRPPSPSTTPLLPSFAAAEESMKRNSSINSSMEHFLAPPKPPTSSSSESEDDEEAVVEHPPQTWGNHTGNTGSRKRLLSKQLSMKETTREAKWEKRRRQILQRKHSNMMEGSENNEGPTVPKMEMKESALLMRRRMKVRSLTDEDLDELRGSIELGFGFNEENGGQNLCDTLPALNLYFAVNRQLSDPKLWSPATTPTPTSSASTICGTPSPRSPNQQQQNGDDWKICNPGDNPQHVKTRLRHWAQAVACSVRQCC